MRKSRRGFTVLELMLGLVAGSFLFMGMGLMVVHMFKGMGAMADFGAATERVDLIRQLTFDARTGDTLLFPEVNGENGAYNESGINGHRVQFRAVEYNPTTEVSTPVFIQWESRRSGNSGPYTVTRWRMVDANNNNLEDDGSYVETFTQGPIQVFTVQRVNRQNFNVEMETTEGEETAHVQLAVTLRNVQ